jgi:hypothetical protein
VALDMSSSRSRARSPEWQLPELACRGPGTLAGVKRLQATRVPRQRQAPDGGKAGGTPPTASSRSTRRVFLAPALPRHEGEKKLHEDLKKSAIHS